mmetsp:Transcript_18558/g.25724  ORF Transcript_18558/g.25724 Transcript_18558/m.25724 type:complete len:178 (+) Transcript_18558:129-662(+)|eukprot:CAMPEP_0196581920 /NCGR_PEP_ID=MMETSP1081-20130531/36514_1 /TAXON_ID=36882 /ORGANISM="Pyramimonas amylifera, Strain CCMP720" /LENGTH=177 /DNA_ID=CAMNT_0041902327 /DNA_START=98 /DNA_END=631 /DNA_ORIENTATION=+
MIRNLVSLQRVSIGINKCNLLKTSDGHYFSSSPIFPTEPLWSTGSLSRSPEGGEIISVESLRKVAHLACLSPNKEDQEELRQDFSKLVHFVQAVSKVNTERVAPMWTPVEQGQLRMRWDSNQDGCSENAKHPKDDLNVTVDIPENFGVVGTDSILASASHSVHPYFTVPKSNVHTKK